MITQVDDGEPSGPDGTGFLPTSSISMPTVVAAMLRALDIHDGRYALEIGTGAGYNAALLAYRLGAGHVTSVEIDLLVADAARHALAQTGLEQRLLPGGLLSLTVAADGTATGRIVDSTWFMQLRGDVPTSRTGSSPCT